MNNLVFYPFGCSNALSCAVEALEQKGCCINAYPDHSVTHLLLPVPSFETDGSVKGGKKIEDILGGLPENVTIVGGNLRHPALTGRNTIDLLRDPTYLAQNANITAHCAVRLAMNQLPAILEGCHVLVIGWGRIGKCLAALLQKMGAIVTVAARKDTDRAMLTALGFDTLDCANMEYSLVRYRLIFNTAPELVLCSKALSYCRPDCVKIDLASKQGMEGNDILWARGLPSKNAPESSGELIARTALRLSTIHHQKGVWL